MSRGTDQVQQIFVYIMSYGGGQRRSLSACNAEFLAVHPYFDPSVEAQKAPPPTIELISQTGYPAGSRSVSVQLEVSDPEGKCSCSLEQEKPARQFGKHRALSVATVSKETREKYMSFQGLSQ